MDIVESLQKLIPWATGLTVGPKIALSIAAVALCSLFLLLIWRDPPVYSKVSEYIAELDEIEGDWDNKFNRVEPLAERVISLLQRDYPGPAREIASAQESYPSVGDIARVLRRELMKIHDQLEVKGGMIP